MHSSEIWSHLDRPLISHLRDVSDIGQEMARSLPQVCLLDASLPEVIWIGGMLHDYAKATESFQNKLRGRKFNECEARHSHLSSILAFQNTWEFLDIKDELAPESNLPLYAYIAVKKHHGNLDCALNDLSIGNDLVMFETQLEQIDVNFVKDIRKSLTPLIKSPLVEPTEVKEALPSIHKRLKTFKRILRRKSNDVRGAIELSAFYSILIDADKLDASGTGPSQREILPEDFVLNHIKNLGEPKSDIDRLRTKAFYEALAFSERVSLGERLLSLTLPTGLGKTYTVMAIAQKLRERISENEGHTPRIIYCLPFTSIIDQNHAEISNLLQSPPSSLIIKHHHLGDTLYSKSNDDEESDYLKSELLIEGWNSEIVVTTFVQLFFTIAGFRNRPLRRMHNIAGSIVILDEVQAIPLKYWHMFNRLATAFSEVLGTRFILVTATQPAIFNGIPEVVPESTQYFSLISRADFDIQLEQMPFEAFKSSLLASLEDDSDHDMLIILNTKKAAESMYRSIKEETPDIYLDFLSTSVIPFERMNRIERIRKRAQPSRIVVSTQIVEAGVDIDFTKVYRDFAPLDSIVQAAGRCNRHMSDTRGEFSVVHLLDDKGYHPTRTFASYIYDSMLLDRTELILKRYGKLEDTDLHQATCDYFREIVDHHSESESREILNGLSKLDYSGLARVKLIENKEFLMTDIFVEYDSEASRVLDEYRKIVDSKVSRWQKKAEFLRIRQDLMKYMLSVYTKDVGIFHTIGSLAYISHDDLERRYDLETGFKSTQESALIL